VLDAVGPDRVVGEIRMHLDLVDRGHRLRLAGEFLEVMDLEVGHPNAAGPAVGLELLQRLPGGDEVAVVAGGQRPVDEEQVDVVGAQIRQRLVEGPAGVIRAVKTVVELAGDEHVATVDTRIPDALTDAFLVAVHLSGVDVPVADLHRRANGRCGLFRGNLVHPEPQLRDLMAVVQGDERDAAHGGAH